MKEITLYLTYHGYDPAPTISTTKPNEKYNELGTWTEEEKYLIPDNYELAYNNQHDLNLYNAEGEYQTLMLDENKKMIAIGTNGWIELTSA